MPSANYVLLEKITVGAAGASSVTFSSIPQTGYTDLVVKASARSDSAVYYTPIWMQINSVTTGYTNKFIDVYNNAPTSATDWFGVTNKMPLGAATGTSDTSSTFSNCEAYIPNYTSANYKSVSIDGVTENNSASNNQWYLFLSSNLLSNTAAISSLTLTLNAGNFVQYSTFYLYGVAKLGTTPAIVPYATGGDTIMTDGTYWYHTFVSSGTFTPQKSLTCDYLVVAGGGAGGGATAYDDSGEGGGGAGGLRSTVTATGGGGSLESKLSLASGTGYTVTIGAGGAGIGNRGNSGSNSVFSTITATGGGGGGGANFSDGLNGGSGGGGRGGGVGGTAGTGTANQGFAGGVGKTGNPYDGGGGGGAGAVGVAATTTAGAGGAGVAISALATPTSTGVSGYYAGGGGGGKYTGTTFGTGGAGGGGNGGVTSAGVNATANTGSGGGGSGNYLSGGFVGGNGGSGIVIVRYAV